MAAKQHNSRIVSAALLLGVASLGSRLVGVIRERVLTTTFGAGDIFDAFVAAFRLPDFVFNLVVLGAFSAAFIPLFTEKLVKKKKDCNDEAFDFALSVLHIVLLALSGLSLIYVVFARQIVPVITPGFTGDKLEMTILLSRIMALQPILLGVSFIFSGILNSFKKFTAYALAPILYNIGIIIGVYAFVPMFGVAGMGWGVVLGAAMHMLVQLPGVWKAGFRWRPVMKWSSADVKKLRRMIIPRMFGLGGEQVNLLLVTILGSSLASGTISVFHIANNVQSLPIGLIGLAFSQAAFPTLAEYVARDQMKKFRDTLTKIFRYILFLIIPMSVFLFLLRAQIIRVLFGDGAFDWEDTILTFETFGLMLLSLFAQATIPLLVRAFYVRQNTIIPVMASLVTITADVALTVWLVMFNGAQWLASAATYIGMNGNAVAFLAGLNSVTGLALAFSITTILNLMILLGTLHWQLDGFNDGEVLFSLLRITIAAVLSGIVLQLLKYPVAMIVDMHRFWGVATQLTIAFGGGVAAYIGLCFLFRCDELTMIMRYVPKRFRIVADEETSSYEGLVE